MTCVFCGSPAFSRADSRRTYGECPVCGGIFADSRFFLFPWCQKRRYDRHENTLHNDGYVRFLKEFIDPVLAFLPRRPHSILDYGSGPLPALLLLLQSYRKEGKLPADCALRGWDPFFAAGGQALPGGTEARAAAGGAELVTCLETAEHFENPAAGFAGIAASLAAGGYAAVGTRLIPQTQTFNSWWYKEDPTHVAFYTKKALEAAASRAGLFFLTGLTERVFLFQKN